MHPSIHSPSMTVPGSVTVRSPVRCSSGDRPATMSASDHPGTPVLAAQHASAAGVRGHGTAPAGGLGGGGGGAGTTISAGTSTGTAVVTGGGGVVGRGGAVGGAVIGGTVVGAG